ncbi:uncharacterized protein LOC125046986 isoform X2 [Penaeus chinensis]|uniref:uncharacterized protein LOC125046986 isoform X2 n=1 Tax=Penaeus chinensis TaxID=139456 RepID=UPI001FB756CC|nr:uncharacterized protein LOC125046986 isoform X2 [Penaeus chinensis]
MEAKILSDGLDQFPGSQALQACCSENMSESISNQSTEMLTGHLSEQGDCYSFRCQQPLDATSPSASLSSACDISFPCNNAHHLSTGKKGRGRPRKNICNNHKILDISKAIRKRGRPRKPIELGKKLDKIGGQMPCNDASVTRKRKLDENALTPSRKRTRFGESSEVDCLIEPEEQDVSIFLDTDGSLGPHVLPERKETRQNLDLSMPYIDFKCLGASDENLGSEDQKMRIHTQRNGSVLERDFIPFSIADDAPSNNDCNSDRTQEIPSVNSVHPEDIVYDVLPWCQEIDNLRPGTVIPASKGGGTMYDLLYQFKIDAGRFLEEATGLNIYVFTESFPTPTNKTPLALFIQMSNGHLLRIKCQHSGLNLSLPIPVNRQNISSDAVYCSTPRPHDYSIDARQTKSGKERWPTSYIQDKRILESQKDWFAFIQRMCYIYPEITDKQWQPYVKLTKLNMNVFDGRYSDFKDQDYPGDNGGDRNTKNSLRKGRFNNVQWDKTSRNPGCHTHTSNNERTYTCTEGCPEHVLIHGKLSPPLSSCYDPEGRFFHIVRILETICMSDIMALVSNHIQREEAERYASKNLHTEEYIPLSSTKSKVKSTHELEEEESDWGAVLKSASRKAAAKHTRKENNVEGFSISKKYSKTTKLCNFIYPKKTRKTIRKKNKYQQVKDLCESTLIKKNGFTIRLWQNYDRNLLQSKGAQHYRCHACKKKCLNAATLRKHMEEHPLCQHQRKRSASRKEFHFCQLCQISLRTIRSIHTHSLSKGHRRIVKEKLQSCCGILSTVSGSRVEPDEENETNLEVLEIIEEKIVVEDDIGECKPEENTCTAVTYIYNNPTINAVEKLCLQRDQMKGMPSVPLSQFLRTCEEDVVASDNVPAPWNLEEEDDPHPGEDDFREDFSASQQEDISCQVGSNGVSWTKRDRDDTDENFVKKRARTTFSGRQRNPEWLEEELTSDLGSHEPWYLKGNKQKNSNIFGEVIHVKRTFKNHARKNNPWKVFWPSRAKYASVESLCTGISHDSGVCCNSGQSPYYPHPLLSSLNELYKSTSPSQVEESDKTKKRESYPGQIPHELYDKSGYRYVDLDRPIEYYNFDFDSEGNLLATTDLNEVDFGKNFSSEKDVFFGEQESDSFSRDLETFKREKESENVLCTEVPDFICRATSPCIDTDHDLNTPQMTPVHEADSQPSIFKDWALSYTASGFDSDFERLWNES